MTHVPPRSLGAIGSDIPPARRPSPLVELARRVAAALLPPPRLVPRVGHVTLNDGRVPRR